MKLYQSLLPEGFHVFFLNSRILAGQGFVKLAVLRQRFQLIPVSFEPPDLCQPLKIGGRLSVFENTFHVLLLLAQRLRIFGNPGRIRMQQNVGTVYKVYMGFHGAEMLRRHILEAEIHLDMFVKCLDPPPDSVAPQNLFRSCLVIAACDELALPTFPSFSEFGTHHEDPSHTSDPRQGMSHAELLPLFLTVRKDADSFPCKHSLLFKKFGNSVPRGRFPGFRIFRIGFHTSAAFQCDDEVPASSDDRVLNPFVVIAAVGEHDDIGAVMGTDILREVESRKISDDQIMLGQIFDAVLPAVVSAVKRDGRQRNDDAADDQYDVCPLVPDHEPLSVVVPSDILGFQGGSALDRAVDYDHHLPRKAGYPLQHSRKHPRLFFREGLKGVRRDLAAVSQKFAELRPVQSRKFRREGQRMFAGLNHEGNEEPQTHCLQPFPHVNVFEHPIF